LEGHGIVASSKPLAGQTLNSAIPARILRSILFQFQRLVMIGFFFAAGAWLEPRLGIVLTTVCTSLMALAVCAVTALMLRRASPGRVSLVNRIAPILLPVGIHLGRGKLKPMVAWSTANWAVIALAGALFGKLRFSISAPPASGRNTAGVLRVLFIIGIVVDALGLGYLMNRWTQQRASGSSKLKSMLPLWMILLLAMSAGFIFSWKGWPMLAALTAGAPPVIVGGFYGLFILVILIFKPRWN
jgi:hypothetical protein